MPRRKRTGNRTFPKRATLWLPFETTMQFTTAAGKVASGDLLGNYFSQTGEEVPIGTTLGPVRATAYLSALVATVNDRKYRLECAMQLVPEGGRATLPSPGTDIIDSMWYGQIGETNNLLEAASGVFQVATLAHPVVTKAMRKVTGNGQELVMFGIPNSNVDYTLDVIGVVMLKLP